MLAKHWFFVVNPNAGGQAPAKRLRVLQQKLQASELQFELAVSKRPGHAGELVYAAIAQGFRQFVVVGGDGSLNEVLQSLAQSPHLQDCTLTSLAWGTGNDWSRQHKLPRKLDAFIAFLSSGKAKRRRQDIGVVHYGEQQQQYFLNSVGCGFDCYLLQCMGHGSGWRLRYYIYLLRCLFSYQAQPMQVTINQQQYTSRSFMLMACKNQFAGGGMRFAPENQLDNQLLECINIQQMTGLERLLSLRYLSNGQINSHPKVKYQRSASIQLDSEADVAFQCDGEIIAQLPIRVSCAQQSLYYLSPE